MDDADIIILVPAGRCRLIRPTRFLVRLRLRLLLPRRIGSMVIALQQDEAAQLASRLWDALAETRRAGQPTVELEAVGGTD